MLPTSGGKLRNLYLQAVVILGVFAACTMQAARADIPPLPVRTPFKVVEHQSGAVWTQATLEDGHIGEVDLDEIRDGDLTSVVELLQEHSEWTGAGPELELQPFLLLESSFRFRQSVHGALVENRGRVDFDNQGRVTRLESAIVNPDGVIDFPTLLEADAIAIAIAALRDHLIESDVDSAPSISEQPSFVEPVLLLDPRGFDEPPRFYWWMTVQTGEWGPAGLYDVTVDAHSGQTRVRLASSQ